MRRVTLRIKRDLLIVEVLRKEERADRWRGFLTSASPVAGVGTPRVASDHFVQFANEQT